MKIIFSPETENNCISALLRHPEIFPDIDNFISETDFQSKIHRNIFSVIKSYLGQGQEANIVLIANKIKGLNISFENMPGDVFDFLEALQSVSQINAFVGLESFKELKRVTIRREIGQTGEKLQHAMFNAKDASIEQIMDMADKLYSGKISYFHSEGGDFDNIYESMERTVEEQDIIEEFGMMGPFRRVNEMYGSLVRPGNITCIGARSGVGKSSLSFDYLTYLQEQYNVPILHLDMGEMSKHETMMRAVCRFTEGKVPMYYVETGKWRNHPEFSKLVRAVWPRVQALHTYYENVGTKSPDQIFSIIRRFYMAKVGRGKQALINYDYLKAFDSSNSNRAEYQFMGDFTQGLKNLITTEVPLPFWTSLQLNRSGITNNKKAGQIDDSENAFSISDRIFQQISHGFIFRKKVMDEMVREPGMGNMKLIPVKYRHLGEHYLDAITPVKLPDGSFQDNYIHLEGQSFTYKEVGDLKTLARKIRIPDKNGDEYENVDLAD